MVFPMWRKKDYELIWLQSRLNRTEKAAVAFDFKTELIGIFVSSLCPKLHCLAGTKSKSLRQRQQWTFKQPLKTKQRPLLLISKVLHQIEMKELLKIPHIYHCQTTARLAALFSKAVVIMIWFPSHYQELLESSRFAPFPGILPRDNDTMNMGKKPSHSGNEKRWFPVAEKRRQNW